MSNTNTISGIYTITNTLNNKIYVGYSNNIKKRFQYHIQDLLKNNHDNPLLQRVVNKYGIDVLLFEILEECSENLLFSQEHYWATILNTHNRKYGYNLLPTNPIIGISKQKKEIYEKGIETRRRNAFERGYWNSEETKDKMRKSSALLRMTPEQKELSRKRASLAASQRVITPEEITKRNNTRRSKGVWHTEETKLKMKKPKTVPFKLSFKRIDHWYSLCKQVIKYDKNLNVIEEFVSVTSAAKSIGSSQGTLGAVCKHNSTPDLKRFRTLKGFIWMIK